MSDEEIKKLIEYNARAIEALTANVSELTRDRQEMYHLIADLTSAQADFYRGLAQTDKRQGEIVEILKILTPKMALPTSWCKMFVCVTFWAHSVRPYILGISPTSYLK